ncbi:MAG: 50S ribosomal protein L13 [Planctomycetota bacterium]|nr:50S ribosomal protein L13 [Planctomycetota bacterium]
MKSYMAKQDEAQAGREWVVVDATDQVLGRLAAQVARMIQGKHKPGYTPHLDTGDFVIILNADKIRVTGRKAEQKDYQYYTGYRSGLKTLTFRELVQRDPARIVKLAVQRMLPKGILGKQLISKLKAYKGTEHPHQAQQPKTVELAKSRG